tara:strand:+ start:4212 stop:4385 length:174 start_codon:yes stop_codon:yes gene_type:complete
MDQYIELSENALKLAAEFDAKSLRAHSAENKDGYKKLADHYRSESKKYLSFGAKNYG